MKTSGSCLICGSGRLRPLHEGVRDHYGLAPGIYAFLCCEDCGSATVHPQPAPEDIPALYPGTYTFKASTSDRGALGHLFREIEWHLFYRSIYRQRLRAFRRWTGLTAGRVLDVGCGSGLFLGYLAAAGYEVEGVDPAPDDAAHAGGLGLRVHAARLEDAKLADEQYDAVCFFSVLEHMPDPAATVAQSWRLLRSGGWLVIEVPVVDSGQAMLLGRRWHAVTEAPRHLTLPSRRGVRHLLTSAGFTGIRSAPGPLLDNAGIVALSLLPGASVPRVYGRRTTLVSLLRRCAGGALVLPGVLLAVAERLVSAGSRAGTMTFYGRKAGRASL